MNVMNMISQCDHSVCAYGIASDQGKSGNFGISQWKVMEFWNRSLKSQRILESVTDKSGNFGINH